MALLYTRLLQTARRSFSTSAYFMKEVAPIDPLELATGKEKAELLALQRGDNDPFRVKPIKRTPNNKNSPIIVESVEPSRLVGCICEDDSNHIKWFWLHDGEPKRCYCGHWFKLKAYDIE